MPLLSEEEKRILLGPVTEYRCLGCKVPNVRNYCRCCDEFFFTCRCPGAKKTLENRHGLHLERIDWGSDDPKTRLPYDR